MDKEYFELQNDILKLEEIIRNLSRGVNDSGLAWKDSQYEKLTERIRTIAASSKRVIQAGMVCEEALKRFENIASEV